MRPTVFINGRFLTQRVTGVQRYAREVLSALDALVAATPTDEFELEVLAPPGTVAPELRAIRFRSAGPLRGNPWEQVTLPLLAKKGLLWSFAATGPLVTSRQVVTLHDAAVYAIPEAFTPKFRLWYRTLFRVLVARVPLILTVSDFSRSEIVRYWHCDSAKIRVMLEGWQHLRRVPVDEGVLARHGLRSGRYVLAVSSPTPNKNFKLIARALEHLAGKDFDVAIAGSLDAKVFGGGGAPQSAAMKYLGYVSDGELRALYEHAGIFVYPSLYEGFGIPAIEAMASGCPVIASNSASLPEVCGDGAVYVSPHDAVGLARAIDELMRDEGERQRLAERGRAVAERYSWEAAARRNFAAMQAAVASMTAGNVASVHDARA
jgi:glycosyltransferase involved in cell wall biosynthesis